MSRHRKTFNGHNAYSDDYLVYIDNECLTHILRVKNSGYRKSIAQIKGYQYNGEDYFTVIFDTVFTKEDNNLYNVDGVNLILLPEEMKNVRFATHAEKELYKNEVNKYLFNLKNNKHYEKHVEEFVW